MMKAGIDNMGMSDILKALAGLKGEVRQRFKAELRGVFGSYVRGEQRAESDLDVLVAFDDEANLLDLVGLSMFLEEKLGLSVDIVPEDSIRHEIRDIVLNEKVSV